MRNDRRTACYHLSLRRFSTSALLLAASVVLYFPGTGSARGTNRSVVINRVFQAYNTQTYNKCGFHIIAHYFSLSGADPVVKSVLQLRPDTDTSIVSPSGKFRIRFDTTGYNMPVLYDSSGEPIPGGDITFADTVAKMCDHVYHVEVDSLGFPPPASDSGAGGGNEYDVYIQSLSAGEYGETDFDDSHPIIQRVNSTYASWMLIRNEFQSTYTQGIPAIEVTIAHEFHHGIQLGNYGLWQDDLWFYELTSTWMEQFVYPGVTDYFQYLSNFFDNVTLSFDYYNPYTYAGYERCIFGIFVQNEYGPALMKTIWEKMAQEPVIPAIEDAFKSMNVDPATGFQNFAQWNYFTGIRSPLAAMLSLSAYPLAADYPLATISGAGVLGGDGVQFSDGATKLSEHFYQIDDGTDTIGISVTNTNFAAAIANDTTSFPFTVGISRNSADCVKELSGGYCLSFSVADHSDWALVPFISGQTLVAINSLVFPQPFNPRTQTLKIPYPFNDETGASLSVFSASGELVSKMIGDNNVTDYLRGKYFVWNGKDKNGRTVASGIYIYVLSDGSKDVIGKIAVVRN